MYEQVAGKDGETPSVGGIDRQRERERERERERAIVQSAKVTWRVVTYIVLCRYTRSRGIYLRYTTA